jgi:alanine dehydrogenase
MSTDRILYLSEADVAPLTLDMGDVVSAIEHAFRLNAEGRVISIPKSSIWIGPGHGVQSLSVVDTLRHVAALKWIGIVPPGIGPSTNVSASIILSDTRTGAICCFMDAQRATALRTAGMSVMGGKYLARPDSREIGFIGAGVQAQSHLRAFMTTLPSLQVVRVHSARDSSAQRFADVARTLGLEAHVVPANDVLAQSDIIVTTVPLSGAFEPFLDAGKARPGVFIAAIDLGRPWIDRSLQAMDLTVIDEEAMRHASKPASFVPPLSDADATLCDLVTGRHPGRVDPEQRTILVSSGSAVADLAIGRLIYQQALACRAGLELPR